MTVTAESALASGPEVKRAQTRGPRHRREQWWRPWINALRPAPWVIVALGVFIAGMYLSQSRRSDVPDHGDWWSDMGVVEGAQRISRFGYWTTRFALPVDDGFELGTEASLYPNWPTFPFELQAIAYDAGWPPSRVRIIPLVETAAAGYLLFCFARLVAGRATAGFALLLFLTATPVRLLSDSFGYVPIDLFGRIAVFFAVAVVATLVPRRQRGAWVFGVAATAVLISANAVLFGFESFPAACIFALGYPLLTTRWRGGDYRPAVVAAVVAPALGVVGAIAGRLLLLAALPGPLGEALRDVKGAAEVRFEDRGFTNTFWGEWRHRLWEYAPVLLVLAIAGVVVALAIGLVRRRGGRLLACGMLVLVAEAAWLVVAREHSHRHVHTVALLTYSLVLPAGWFLARATAGLRRTRGGAIVVGIGAAAGAAVLLGNPGLDSYGNVVTRIDWGETEAEMAEIQRALPPGAFVAISGSVVNNGPVLEYMVTNPVVRLPNDHLVELAAQRPLVYIYRRDFPDAAAEAALSAGATTLGRTASYALLTFPSPSAIPAELDPDG